MLQTNINPIKTAIGVAEQEKSQLIEKIKELEKIKERVSQLEVFIEKGQELLGVRVNKSDSFAESTEKNRSEKLLDRMPKFQAPPELPHHLKAELLLKEIGRPMKLNEIVDEFRKRGWRLSPTNGREVLRFALNKRPGIFKKHKDGRYSLVERRD